MENSSPLQERARVVERLYHEASALRPSERHTFLAKTCRSDEALRREVELLLEQSGSPSGLLDAPTGRIAERLLGVSAATGMRVRVGTQLGSYTITAVLGKGGMGEVYRARDGKLRREVAIKFLSSERSSGESLKRFEREARVASSLNHPHILTVHHVDEFEGSQYIVTELVDGGTLKDWLTERARPWQQVVELLIGVADGLAAAHDADILHRDIKPANILVSRNGYAKLADFGLATLHDQRPSEASTQGATNTTLTGTIIGTVRYMSPEQAAGLPLDARSDVFSFGIVVYEALTGVRPFDSDSDLQVLQAIINDKPSPLGAEFPAGLRAVVDKALEKDPSRRYKNMREMVADLKGLLRSHSETPGMNLAAGSNRPSPTGRGRRWIGIGFAAVLVIAAGAWFSRGPSKPATTTDAPPAAQPALGGEPAFDLDKIQITKEDRLIVADFVNNTKDPVFDVTLLGALFDKLEQSNVVRPMSPGQVERYLEQMLKPDAKLTPELAKEVCIRSGEKAMLVGSIAGPLGNIYQLLLTATNCTTGETLATAQRQADGQEKVLDALSYAVDDMRQRLGERLAESQKPGGHESVPLTTASLKAYQAYAMGLELLRHDKNAEANAHFKLAREIDPTFARAWQTESDTAGPAGRAAERLDLLRKAYDNRNHATDVERLMVEASYAGRIEKDLEKARRLWDQVLRLAPHAGQAQNALATIYAELGNRKQATELLRKALLDHPDFVFSYTNLASNYVATGHFSDARSVLARAGKERWEIPDLHRRLLQIAYLENDRAAIERETPLAERESEADVRTLQREYAYATGRFKEADALGNVGSAANGAPATDSARRAFAEDCTALPATGANAFALLRCGELERAAQSAEQALRNPDLSRVNASVSRAILSMAQGKPEEAVKELAPRVRVDSPPYLYLVALSKAYMDLNKHKDAAQQLATVVSQRSNLFQAGFPRAHVDLARALEKAGDKAGAIKAYDAFFKLWKEADGDIPLLIKASRENAALQQAQ